MADPTGYTVSYSFAGYQAINPDEPLPAADVDVEFANIETSLVSVIAALAEVRRADGNLQNDIVTWDALDADVQDRITATIDRVTIGDINASAFASQVEAETGVANDKIMTPLRARQAVDNYRAFASQVEAQAGALNTVVMTPLRTVEALGALRAFASQAEAEAGTEAAKVSSPLRVAQAVDALRTAFTATAALTWGAAVAAGSIEQSVTVTGAVVGDRVAIGLPTTLDAGLVVQAWVDSADTVRVRITNITAAPITPHGGVATDYSFTALRF